MRCPVSKTIFTLAESDDKVRGIGITRVDLSQISGVKTIRRGEIRTDKHEVKSTIHIRPLPRCS